MTDLVRAELHKIRTTRLWWGLLIGAVLFTALQAGVQAALAGASPGPGAAPLAELDTPGAMRAVFATAALTGAYLFAMVLGITGMTGEYRYQTISATFLASPHRGRVVVAKLLAHVVTGLVYGLVALVTALVVGLLVALVRGASLDFAAEGLVRSMLLAVVGVALWTLIGVGVGSLIRNQVAAILVAVLVAFLVEPLLGLLLTTLDQDAVAKYLPSQASSALTQPAAETGGQLLSWWAGALVMLGYALVASAVGVLLSRRRDIS